MTTLTISGTAADDIIVVTAAGADSGSYSINGGPAVAFSGVTQLAVTGGAGNDTLTIVNPTGGLFAPVNGISYDGGGQPADTLEILGGVATQLTYTAGATHDAGTLVHTGAAGTQTIDFAGIAPITDTVAAATLVIKGTTGNDAISVTDGGLVNGQQTTQVSAATFESIRFANKATVTIDGNGGVDSITFNNPNVAAGLTELDVVHIADVKQIGAVNYTNLSLDVFGDVDLDSPGNDVTNLAVAVSGEGRHVIVVDADDLTLTSAGGVNGVSTKNGSIGISTMDGALTVANTATAIDVNAGTSAVGLVAGSRGPADFAVNVNAGANVTGAGGMVIAADHMNFASGAAFNAGNAIVTLRPWSVGTQIDLGGADGANTLGLTDSELDGISAATLRVGDSGIAGRISFVSEVALPAVSQLELYTSADIVDKNAGTDVSVDRLAMSAVTGIGESGDSIDTDVRRIEAYTDTGGLNIANAGAVTIGGVGPNFTGLHVNTAGDLRLIAGGYIDLADVDGLESVHGGAISGDVFLTAIGADADVSSQVDRDAIMAQAGNITVTAERNILFGTAVANQNSDVLANGSITLSAGRSIFLDGLADVVSDSFGNDTGGGVTATAVNNLFVFGSEASIGAAGNAGADVTLTTTGENGLVIVGAFPVNPVFSISGDVTINADRMLIAGVASIVGGQSVTLQPVSSDRSINLGSTNDAAAGTLELSDAELDSIFTPILRIGSTAMTGNITVSSPIASDGDYATLSLRTGGGIVDGSAGIQADITVTNLALRAATGIGHVDSMEVHAANLAFSNSGTGDVNIQNGSSLTLAALDGLAASSNAGGYAQVKAHGALTVATNVTASGPVNLIAEEASGLGDNVTVLAGTTVQSTNGAIQLGAGDDVVVQAGSTLQAELVIAAVDAGSTDAGVGGTVNFNGTVIAVSGTSISGRGDNDVLNGTPLDDAFDGRGGADIMLGGAGNDTYFVDNGGDTVTENAGEGIDRVLSFTHFVLPDNVENLRLLDNTNLQGYGNDLANTIVGNDGSNLLDGRGGADIMRGGLGNDVYMVDNAGDTVTENAGEGNDAVFSTAHFALSANVETLVLKGSADLQGYGNNLANALYGNAGNNLLNGQAGADIMFGGLGNDTYFVDGGDGVVENANEGNDTVFSTTHFALSANVENLVLQGNADLQGYGNDLANALYGNTGNNLLNGGAGADIMFGGLGNDTYFVDGGDGVIENANEGNDTVFATMHFALSANVENLVLQGNADPQGYGNNLANMLYGNAGANLLDGRGGADIMRGGGGNDAYFVDDAGDMIIENFNEGADAVFATAHFAISANVETLVLQGSADLQSYGNDLANALYGNTGNNILNGEVGADIMVGGAGSDAYFVDNAGDMIIENPNEGTDAVFATVDHTLAANVETLVLQGSGNSSGTGNALANSVYGNSGNNTLNGGAAADLLMGNAGNDTFVFNAGQGNGDSVVDFAGNGAAAGDALQFAGYGAGASFTNIDATHWQVNYNGGTSHDVITFMNGAAIDASDFMFV